MPVIWQPASVACLDAVLRARHVGRPRPLPDDQGVRRAPGGTLAPFIYVQMLWMVIIGFIWFRDWPAITTWIGIALIVGSGLYACIANASRPAKGADFHAFLRPYDMLA
jgi:hypothetical protein